MSERLHVLRPFANALKEAREEADMSQRALADLSGLNHATLSRLEDGSRNPKLDSAVKLGLILGLDPAQRLTLYESILTDQEREDIENVHEILKPPKDNIIQPNIVRIE